MGSQRNWRYAVDADDWMRFMEKRVMHEERRPVIRNGSDLLGPGMATPYASQTYDWNDPACLSDGFWYSLANLVRNSPEDAAHWMGVTEGTQDGYGLQTVAEYRTESDADPIQQYQRRFWTVEGRTNFGTWRATVGGGGGGGGSDTVGPTVRMALTTNQRINHLQPAEIVLWEAVEYSTPPEFADLATSQLVFPESGQYIVVAYVVFEEGPGVGYRIARAYLDGTQIRMTRVWPTTGAVQAGTTITINRFFTQGQRLDIRAEQTSGAFLDIVGGAGMIQTSIEAAKVVIGPKGDPGPPGPTGTASYTFVQGAAAATWLVTHPLVFHPNITVVDSTGRQVEGDVEYTSPGLVTINFSGAFAGTAYLS